MELKKVLIIGAGRSSTAMIDYLLKHASLNDWSVTVADTDIHLATTKIRGHSNGIAVRLDVFDVDRREALIRDHDIVISFLPAFLHMHVAKDCLTFKKHLVTASYVSKEMDHIAHQASDQGLIFMGEMGLDPGIDHMSAMKKIHEITESGGILDGFYSYTGGLIAPESDTNPWHYKFTWNPRNVVLAGQGTAKYIEEGQYRYTPYSRIFEDVSIIDIPDFGPLEMYANRDSLSYREIYGIDDIPTIVRGTLRYPGFSEAWNVLVQIGLTDDTYVVMDADKMTYGQWVDAYLDPKAGDTIQERLAAFMDIDTDGEVMQKLEWAGIFSDDLISLKDPTPAQILEDLLSRKWALNPGDKDLIVMQHEFYYTRDGQHYKDTSTLIVKGSNEIDTAMCRLVGLPVAIFVKEVMLGKMPHIGVHIPIVKEVYEPVLTELENYGVTFIESTVEVK